MAVSHEYYKTALQKWPILSKNIYFVLRRVFFSRRYIFIYLKLSPIAVLIFRLTRQRFSADNVFILRIGACNGAINVICVTCSLKIVVLPHTWLSQFCRSFNKSASVLSESLINDNYDP